MAATLSDIARETRTSVSTVSRVLAGGDAASRISPETRQRVIDASKRLGYRPNLLARSLRTRRTNSVALLVSDIANPFFARLSSLIESALHRHGYSLILCNSNDDEAREAEYLDLLPRKGIDAIILTPLLRSKKAILEHVGPELPLIILDRAIAGMSAQVVSDQEQGTQALCDALKRNGVGRIALISGPADVSTHRRRCEVIKSNFEVALHHSGHANRSTGNQASVKINNTPVDAIICTNNQLATGYLETVTPGSPITILACVDDIPMMDLLPVPILSAEQDIPSMAEACVHLLMPLVRGEPFDPQPVVLPMRIVSNDAFKKRHG